MMIMVAFFYFRGKQASLKQVLNRSIRISFPFPEDAGGQCQKHSHIKRLLELQLANQTSSPDIGSSSAVIRSMRIQSSSCWTTKPVFLVRLRTDCCSKQPARISPFFSGLQSIWPPNLVSARISEHLCFPFLQCTGCPPDVLVLHRVIHLSY